MRFPLGEAMARSCAAFALLVGALLVAVLPTLFSTPVGTSGMAAVVLALIVLALAGRGVRCLALAGQRRRTDYPMRRMALPAVPGSATDPVHSPLRPRAPGLA